MPLVYSLMESFLDQNRRIALNYRSTLKHLLDAKSKHDESQSCPAREDMHDMSAYS